MTPRITTIEIGELKARRIGALTLKIMAISALLVGVTAMPASAHDRFFRGPGPFLWPFAVGAAVVTGAVVIATAPFRALAALPPYYQTPTYYAPPAPYYGQPQAYPPAAYYAPPTPNYAQPQSYYPPPGYYPPQGYVIAPR